jgi:hypothetical protein
MVIVARRKRSAFSSHTAAGSRNTSSRALEGTSTVGIEDTPASAEGASGVVVGAFGTDGTQGSPVGPLFVMTG